MERRGTRWQHKKAGGRFKGVSSKEEREREDTRSDTKQREGEGPIRRMKRRLARWKECRRTSAGGQPCARGFSLASRRLSRPGRLCLRGIQERIPCPSHRLFQTFLSLPPLPPPSSPLVTPSSSSSSIALRPLLPCKRTGTCARLWWLLIPPGASLVTHAAPRGSLDPLDPRAPRPGLSLRQAHASPTCD